MTRVIEEEEDVITPANLYKQKLSTLFYSVYEDLTRMIKLGIGINMESWASASEKKCSVCLGGAAVMGFIPSKCINKESLKEAQSFITEYSSLGQMSIDGVEFSWTQKRKLYSMARMFNCFRLGDRKSVV